MSEIKDWLSTTKQEKPEISDFINSFEGYISDVGFDASEFEKVVDTSLKSVENEVRKQFKDDEHAKD